MQIMQVLIIVGYRLYGKILPEIPVTIWILWCLKVRMISAVGFSYTARIVNGMKNHQFQASSPPAGNLNF